MWNSQMSFVAKKNSIVFKLSGKQTLSKLGLYLCMILGDIYLAGLTIAKAKQIKLTGKNFYNTYIERIDILIYYHIVKSNIVLL